MLRKNVIYPDLIVQRITPSNYYPTRGDTIAVDMVIKNQGNADADDFYVGLYYNPSYPPDIYTYKDKVMHVNTLHSTDTLLVRFENVTAATPGTWNMYGLVDCYGRIDESNETNNVIGPTTVHWLDPGQFPDLVIEDVQVSGYCPYVNESLYVDVTIANRGGMSADMFVTNFYYNLSSRPQSGYDCEDCDDCWLSYWGLEPGERETFTFTVKNNPPFGTTWTMWLWVDPGNIVEETNENNNLDSIEIEWHDLPTFRISSMTRDQIINKGLEFTNVRWVCPVINDTARHCSFEADWTSDYVVGVEYKGEAYEWGSFDDTLQFRCNLEKGLRAGSHQDNDCLPGRTGNPSWATGIDCSGLVTRAFGIPTKKNTSMLIGYCDSLKGGFEYVLRGDALIKREIHTYLFDSWSKDDSMLVVEAGDFRDEDPDGSSEARLWNRPKWWYETYFAFKFKDVPLIIDNNRSGDANSSGRTDVADIYYLVGYLFQHGAEPHPLWRGNSNGDCKVDVADIVYLVNYLFKGGPAPYDCQPCAGWTCISYP
ncbi:MAG: hypothetical protein MUP17_00130 [candidate division Zixibacteria bacterium]|nr:hypothetical protein [candidate division Zixibacteria bacterium]